ncbi:AMP-binding protein [Phenylobacterium sp. VNQ135]|uniref:AMP-binding protein n=1 Tax=Phenylobacterium sp. VNQ135 TaxID=3400922 RepID=UPI003C02CAFB
MQSRFAGWFAGPKPLGGRLIFYGPDAQPLAFHGRVFSAILPLLSSSAGCRVGVIGRTRPETVEAWFAVLAAGGEPMFLQFPTEKLSRSYWEAEIAEAVRSAGLSLLLCAEPACRHPDPGAPQIDLWSLPLGPARDLAVPQAGAVLQMSSGTTGHRKPMRFDLELVRRHLEAYGQVTELSERDTVVSWLPLYHDMGFVAAFLAPLAAGAQVALLDPVDWVRKPQLLWRLLRRHGEAVCYMPNFAFEVMADAPGATTRVKRWISCSEPTREATLRRFCERTATPWARIRNCWGMAEAIFAVSEAAAPEVREIDGERVVSCGRPIPGVEIKAVEGALHVRSPYALEGYLDRPLDRDEDGFFATGDLGVILDGEVYLRGRARDLANVAGRKFLLSDMDARLAERLPQAAGRIASLAEPDPALGTDRPLVLVEDPAFWRRDRDGEARAELATASGVETTQVRFVPPRFITKTSSGKINRPLTLAHWRARTAGRSHTSQRRTEALRELFPGLDWSQPIRDQLDSLGRVNLVLELRGDVGGARIERAIARGASLSDLLTPATDAATDEATAPDLRVVSLCDANPLQALAGEALARLSRFHHLQVQHVCAPPPGVLLSDLVFSDYFRARDPDVSKYADLEAALATIRNADLLLIDDAVTLFWPGSENDMAYPRLSHQFRPRAEADLLGLRWAGYSAQHHRLACDLAPGHALVATAAQDLADLCDYLQTPAVRIAYSDAFSPVTAGWEVQGHGSTRAIHGWDFDGIDRDAFAQQLTDSILRALQPRRRRLAGESQVSFADQPHWCSWLVNVQLLDYVLRHFNVIGVQGRPSSAPYLAAAAAARGRTLVHIPDLSAPAGCDCIVQLGSWGDVETDKPVFQAMGAGWGPLWYKNLPAGLPPPPGPRP